VNYDGEGQRAAGVTVPFVSLRGWFPIRVDATMYRGEHMKLFQLSWTLGLPSNIVLGALTRSWSPLVEMSPGIQKLATILLLILPAGIGTVLGVMSKNRKEVKAWWSIGVIGLNMLMLFTGTFLLFAG